MEERAPQSPMRRWLLAALVLPDPASLLQQWRPKPDSYREWFDAIRLDDTRVLRALLARGFDPNSVEPERFDTGLILAVRLKSPKTLALLLDTPNVNIDARSHNGDTALMVAAYQSDTTAAISLVDKGAEINRPGWTALHYASASGNVTIIRKLLDKSAYIDAESPNRTTPLMMAARSGHSDAVKLLLDEGADVAVKNEAGLDAADFARAQGFLALAQVLELAMQSRPSSAPSAD
jgi:ankyrin repeat protein